MKKFKIMFVISSMSAGGAEKHVLYLANELLKSGNFHPMIVLLGKKGPLFSEAKNLGINLIILKRQFRFDIFIAIKLSKIMKNEEIAIVHSHMFYSNMVTRFAAKLARIPIVVATEHGLSTWKKKYLILLDRITQGFVDKIITVSNASKSIRLRREKIHTKKLVTIHNFINVENFHPSSNINYNLLKQNNLEGYKIIGMVTRLAEIKRIEDTLFAMKNVLQVYPNVKLVIIGTGPLKDRLINISKESGISKNVLFLGFQNNIVEWLNIFHLYVLSSLREDCSLSLLEAMAMAKPVVVTSVGGNPELVINNVTGKLVPPMDSEKLGKEILWMLNNYEVAKKMGVQGRERIEKHFSANKVIPRILSLYNELIDEKLHQ